MSRRRAARPWLHVGGHVRGARRNVLSDRRRRRLPRGRALLVAGGGYDYLADVSGDIEDELTTLRETQIGVRHSDHVPNST